MSKSIIIHAPAKINLCLDILERTASGYHKIQTVFQEIPEIYDEISIETAKNHDNLSILPSPSKKPQNWPVHANKDSSSSPVGHVQSQATSDDKNLAYLALRLIRTAYAKKISKQNSKKFVRITIKKNIPISSGLGGASSDAAAVLKGLNKFWNLEISTRKLLSLAAKLGKDVPFFILGGTALGTNFGEKITALPPLKNIKFKIFTKSANSATKTQCAYASLDLSLCGKETAKTQKLIKILKACKNHLNSPAKRNSQLPNSSLQEILQTFHNDFETLPMYRNICLDRRQSARCTSTQHLSGSGPSTFSII